MSTELPNLDELPVPRGKRTARLALFGAAAGLLLGVVFWCAGLASNDAAIRFVQIVAILVGGGGIGAVLGYGPRRILRGVFGFDRPGASVRECVLCTAFSALRGLFVGPIGIVIFGFVAGGIGRASPACHAAPDFFSGAIFGMFAFTGMLAVPAAVIGAVTGGLLSALLYRWRFLLPYIDLPLAILTVPLAWLYGMCFF